MNSKKIRIFLIGAVAIGVVYNIYFYREDVKMESSVVIFPKNSYDYKCSF